MSISAEAHFITLATREPANVSDAELRAAATAVADWPSLIDAAAQHRVAAFVQQAVARVSLTLPPEAQHALRQSALDALARVMLLDNELRRVAGVLAARAIPVILLKGPVLARTIYPAAALRPYGDIDLTVRVADEAEAVAALLDCDFHEVPHGAEEARRAHAAHVHNGAGFHRLFVSAGGGALVELHLDPLQLGLQPACEAGRWDRALAVPGLDGVLMLCAEDQLVQLAVHAHKHGFDRLIWLKDIDLLLRASHDGLDWDLIDSVARAEGVRSSVWYTIRLARMMLGTPVPPAALRRLNPSTAIRVLYGLVWPTSRVMALCGHMRRRAVQLHAADSMRGTIPNLVLMGRRRDRARAALSALMRR
jgi:hypothetical protein